MSDQVSKYFKIEQSKPLMVSIIGSWVRKNKKSCYKGVAYNNTGSLYISSKEFSKDWLLKKCFEERGKNSYYNLSIETKNSINSLEKKDNIKLSLPGYTFVFNPEKQPLLLIGEMLNRNMVLDELSINYCSKDYADGENLGFHTFDNINKELQKHQNASQIPVLVCDEYKNHAKTNQIHLVSMFFNKEIVNYVSLPDNDERKNGSILNSRKDFVIVDSLLDYVEKDEQLFIGLEQIFAFELNGKNNPEKITFLKDKLKKSSLYQYPIQSENNCGRFAVKFYARFADYEDIKSIRKDAPKVLLEVCSEISDEVTLVMVEQKEERSVRPWDDSLLNNGYAKVNVGDKTFAVRIPKPEELKFDNQSLSDYKEYSGSEGTFHEKCNHGQGVLTGGVLLNLGVSREQLREMVNNHDKPIEITVKEIEVLDYQHKITPDVEVKVDGENINNPFKGCSTQDSGTKPTALPSKVNNITKTRLNK